MKEYLVMAKKYGYAHILAENEEDALCKARDMQDDEFDWSYRSFDDDEVVDEEDVNE